MAGKVRFIGAHVSASGGLHNAFSNAASIGANALALFIRNQRRWTSPDLKGSEIEAFKTSMGESGIPPSHIIVHGSYLINLGNPDKEKRDQSFQAFLDEARRCEALGLTHYNIHPGAAVDGCDKNTSMNFISDAIDKVHESTERIIIVLETMAGQGSSLGSTFEEIRYLIDRVKCKERVGVCVDTCHIFAAGYDIRSQKAYEDTMMNLEKIIGINRVMAFHLNDSKGELGCRKDRHENIGKGFIGLDAFKMLMQDERFSSVPFILETPDTDPDIYKREIEILRDLV